MANIKDYINENLNEAMVGNVDLKRLADKASEHAKKVPMGASINNRLAKAGEKALAAKFLQAQKMVEELRAVKKKIAPLKDSDQAGRKAVKQTLQRLATGLAKMTGLQAQAEKALAASKSKGEVKDVKEKWQGRKKDFKERVKENLAKKRAGRVESVKSKAKRAKDYVINFTNEETLEEMAKADIEGITLSSPEAAAKAYIKKYEERMGKDFDSRGAGAAKRVIVAFIADKDKDEDFADKMVAELKKLAKKTEKKPAKKKEEPDESEEKWDKAVADEEGEE